MKIQICVRRIPNQDEWWTMKWMSNVLVDGQSVGGTRSFTKEEALKKAQIDARTFRSSEKIRRKMIPIVEPEGWKVDPGAAPTWISFVKTKGQYLLHLQAFHLPKKVTYRIAIHAGRGNGKMVQEKDFDNLSEALSWARARRSSTRGIWDR